MIAIQLATAAATLETLVSHKKGVENWPRCLSDVDCQSGSPVPADSYCDLEEHRCLCRLFHAPLNGSCRRVQCSSSFDCGVGSNGQHYDADWWFTCTKDGQCRCQWPKVLISKDTACSEPVWVTIIGSLLLASSLLFFAAFFIVCHFFTAFFESRCRRPPKTVAAAAEQQSGSTI